MPVTTSWWAWGWYYSIEVLDDFSRFVLASDLKPDMTADSISDVVEQAMAFTGMRQVPFQDRGLLRGSQPVPHRTRFRLAIHQPGLALLAIASLPTMSSNATAQFGDGRSLGLRRTPHQLDQLG